jgi:hypothetical protein
MLLPDDEVARLVRILRTANVRESEYREAAHRLLDLAETVTSALHILSTDYDVLVRGRAAQLLQRIGKLAAQTPDSPK